MRLKKPILSSRAASRIRPAAISMPASRRRCTPAPTDLRIGVLRGHHHARHAGLDQRIGARRRAPVVAAGLERDIGRRAASALARCAQCVHFGMRLAGTLVPALADDFVAVRDHAADARIGLRGEQTLLGQAQRTRHVTMVGGAERGRIQGHRDKPSGTSAARVCARHAVIPCLGLALAQQRQLQSLQLGQIAFELLDFLTEGVHVLEATIHGRKAHVADLVELLQLAHDQLADLTRGHLALAAAAQVVDDGAHRGVDVVAGDRTLLQRALRS